MTTNVNLSASRSYTADLAKMHEVFGHTAAIENMTPEQLVLCLKFRLDFILEELKESYLAAGYQLIAEPLQVEAPENLTLKDADGLVDGLTDVTVLSIGTMDFFGIDADKAWDAVYTTLMNKKSGVNPNRPNPMNLPDMLKPEGWKSPVHMDNLGMLTKFYTAKQNGEDNQS